MSKTATKKSASGVGLDESGTRAPSPTPQLLAQLPGSLLTSPGFIMGIVAVECLYGLFLFAVMSRPRREPPPVESIARAPRVELPVMPPPEPKEPPPTQQAKAEPAQPPPATKVVEKAAAPEPAPAPAPPKKKSNRRKKGARDPSKTVALAPTPKPEPVIPKDQPTIPPLGPLIDPKGDCRSTPDGDALTISVPAGPHVFDAQRDVMDAPRALAEVTGDFLVEVKVPGEIKPGSSFVKGLNFSFQGAGILLWQDKDNYVRFERAGIFTGQSMNQVFIESRKDGKPGKGNLRKVREGPITLRLERKGRELIYSYSVDGKTWLKLDQSAVNLAPSVSVGVSASNVSTRKFEARFSDFVLKRSS